jgi:peptidoglycan/xylan/chitin deacetylase (PgdA/CDA1 family)
MSVYARRGLIPRAIMLAIALFCRLLTGFGRLRSGRVITLCYHGVTDAQRSSFRRQMTSIARRATLHPDEHRRRRFARPRVCVTFDDAFDNLLDNALPVTRELGIPVTVFVPTACLGAPPGWSIAADHPDAGQPVMTADSIERLAADGICCFGSHSATHRALPDLPPDEARRELIESKSALEQIAGCAVSDFAFPYGECNRRLIDEARSAGYRRIYTLDPPARLKRRDADVIPRMRMSPDAWFIEFRLTVCGAYDWLPAARRLLRRMLMRSHPRHSQPARTDVSARGGATSTLRQPAT